tara:strand:+ start:805 stop:924 length:120 start_codon:yes stop_codon:yes gene_type:complete
VALEVIQVEVKPQVQLIKVVVGVDQVDVVQGHQVDQVLL